MDGRAGITVAGMTVPAPPSWPIWHLEGHPEEFVLGAMIDVDSQGTRPTELVSVRLAYRPLDDSRQFIIESHALPHCAARRSYGGCSGSNLLRRQWPWTRSSGLRRAFEMIPHRAETATTTAVNVMVEGTTFQTAGSSVSQFELPNRGDIVLMRRGYPPGSPIPALEILQDISGPEATRNRLLQELKRDTHPG